MISEAIHFARTSIMNRQWQQKSRKTLGEYFHFVITQLLYNISQFKKLLFLDNIINLHFLEIFILKNSAKLFFGNVFAASIELIAWHFSVTRVYQLEMFHRANFCVLYSYKIFKSTCKISSKCNLSFIFFAQILLPNSVRFC